LVLQWLCDDCRFLVQKPPSWIILAVTVAATEASDDDGLPHTLEHLVFLGSEDYPFKASTVL